MKFEIIRASHIDMPDYPGPGVKNAFKETKVPYEGAEEVSDWYINIDTLEELVKLQNEVGHDLIFTGTSIWIYDDRME